MPIRFQVDPDFYDHPKTLGMSDAAVALWVRAGSYSAAKRSDGFVADAALAGLSQTPAEAARELIRRRLWSRVKGGYRFHQWSERNLTRTRIEADRKADRDRKRRDRESGRQTATPQVEGPLVPPDIQPDSGGNPNGIHPLSVSVSLSGSVSGSGHDESAADASANVAVLEPPRRCSEHANESKPPPCGACAEARKAADDWQAERRKRWDHAPRCRSHRGQLAHNCSLCRADALVAQANGGPP